MSPIPFSRKIDIARRAIGKPGAPRFASLFLTRKCNLACPYCKSISQPFKDIDLESWDKTIDRLHDFGVRVFTLTGGEPLLYSGIMEIVGKIVNDRKSVCWMISNGKALTKETIDELASLGMQFLTCSLDSFSGHGVKSRKELLDMLAYAKTKGIICSTLSVITKDNFQEIPAILEEVTRRGIIFDMGLYQHVGGLFSPSEKELKPVDMAALESLRKIIRRKKLQTGLVSPSWGYLKESLEKYDSLSWKCSSDTDRFLVINNNGCMMACQEHETDIPVLELQSLHDPRWRTAKRDAVDACDGCFYGCYYQKENMGLLDILLDTWTMIQV